MSTSMRWRPHFQTLRLISKKLTILTYFISPCAGVLCARKSHMKTASPQDITDNWSGVNAIPVIVWVWPMNTWKSQITVLDFCSPWVTRFFWLQSEFKQIHRDIRQWRFIAVVCCNPPGNWDRAACDSPISWSHDLHKLLSDENLQMYASQYKHFCVCFRSVERMSMSISEYQKWCQLS